jgi:cell division protein FtsB
MIMLAAIAMVVSTIRREQQEVQRARANLAQTYQGVTQLESENARLKAEITRLKTDRSLAEREAQRKLNYVRPGEIVVPIR